MAGVGGHRVLYAVQDGRDSLVDVVLLHPDELGNDPIDYTKASQECEWQSSIQTGSDRCEKKLHPLIIKTTFQLSIELRTLHYKCQKKDGMIILYTIASALDMYTSA
jgi:hypothetical protein